MWTPAHRSTIPLRGTSCEHCTDSKFGYLDGQVGRPSESTGNEAPITAQNHLTSAVESVVAGLNGCDASVIRTALEPITSHEAVKKAVLQSLPESPFLDKENSVPVVLSNKRTNASISQADIALANCERECNKIRNTSN